VSATGPVLKVDAVVFDLGRVLIDYDWQRALEALRPWTGLEPAETERRVLTRTRFTDFETGRIAPEEFHTQLQAALATRIPFAVFRELWCSIFTAEIVPVANVARALLRGGRVKVAALSNTNALHAEFLRRTWPLLNELPHAFLSNEIGLRKPDPAAFRLVLERLAVAPGHVVFVDDLAENVTVAGQLGMKAILAHGPERIVADLARLGLTG
jgi:putative hydrolase of the HAD superfamily